MKKYIFILTILFPLFCFSQEYSEVIQIEGKTADQLYGSSHAWMAIVFNSANDVIQLADPANKKLIAKGIKDIDYVVSGIPTSISMYFSLITEFKDGKYRYQIYPTKFESKSGEEYSYELLKDITTEEGLTNYYKSLNIKSWIIGKKQFAANLESNKLLFEKINSELQKIPKDLETDLKKENQNNW